MKTQQSLLHCIAWSLPGALSGNVASSLSQVLHRRPFSTAPRTTRLRNTLAASLPPLSPTQCTSSVTHPCTQPYSKSAALAKPPKSSLSYRSTRVAGAFCSLIVSFCLGFGFSAPANLASFTVVRAQRALPGPFKPFRCPFPRDPQSGMCRWCSSGRQGHGRQAGRHRRASLLPALSEGGGG